MRLYQPLQTPGANWAAATSVVLIAQQVEGKAVRDALFLSTFHAHSLPFAMASAALLSLVGVVVLTRLLSRHSPARILPVLFALSACGFALEWAIGLSLPHVSTVLVYLHTALFGPALITTFWSLVNERFDPHTAKRAVSRIAGGGTLGGVLAGLAAWRAANLLPAATFVLFLAALNALGVVGTLFTRARREPLANGASSVPPNPSDVSPVAELKKAPFLRNLGLLVMLGAATSTLLDYIFSVQAAAAHSDSAGLLYFFSLFWLAVSVLSFVLQVLLGRVALEKLGLAVSIAFLPGIILIGGAFGLAVPGLLSASLLRGGEAVQRNTLFRSAYELLYTPLSEERKRATKALIDIGFDRAGTVLGSALAFAAIALFTSAGAPTILLGVVVVLALMTLPLVQRLHIGYVKALRESLREGAEKLALAPIDEGAPPSREMRARDAIIEHVEALQPGGVTALVAAEGAREVAREDAVAGPALETLGDLAPFRNSLNELLSGDTKRIRMALTRLSGSAAAGCAILLLAHHELHGDAFVALRSIAPSITGQLLDALLDPEMDFVVRRRLPRVIAACASQRAADGLLLGIADERFEVRYQCGRALMRITDAHPQVVITKERVIEAVRRELERGKAVLESLPSEELEEAVDTSEPTSLTELLVRDRVDRSLEHLFTILSLNLEREPLRMAFRALHQEDERHRGTALEYLETVLPIEVKDELWPYLGLAAPLAVRRPPSELLAELTSLANVPNVPNMR